MAINNRPKPPISSVDDFVSGAPDAGAQTTPAKPSGKGCVKGSRFQINAMVSMELLATIDEIAAARGISRSATINLLIFEGIKGINSMSS